VDSKRNTPVVDFGVERHTLVTEEITQIFHQSLAAVSQVPAARAHLFRVSAQLLSRYCIDLSQPRRIQRFPSDPVEKKARHIYCPVSRQIPTEESSGAHFPTVEVVTLGEDTFGVPERSSNLIQGNPSDPFHSRPGRSV
jgi:hypothetical protein